MIDGTAVVEVGRLRQLRLTVFLVYGLYLAAFFSGITLVIGVIVAYARRGKAAGTPYASHLANAITVFWVALVVGLIGTLLLVVLIGWLVLALLTVWVLWRTIKGLLRTIDGQAYD